MNNGMDSVKFAVDRMLVKLGVYLRIIGCDTVWDLSLVTIDMVRVAVREERVFLTRNTTIGSHTRMPEKWLYVADGIPVLQFQSVVREFHLDTSSRRFTRCLICNSCVEPVDDRGLIEKCVPPLVRRYNKKITRCPLCDKYYWHGMHVENSLQKLGINDKQS